MKDDDGLFDMSVLHCIAQTITIATIATTATRYLGLVYVSSMWSIVS